MIFDNLKILLSGKGSPYNDTKDSERATRRRRRSIRFSCTPLLPRILKQFLALMIILPLADLAAEAYINISRYGKEGLKLLAANSSYSMLVLWALLALFTVPFCLMLIVKTMQGKYTEQIYRFSDEIPSNETSEQYTPVNADDEPENRELILYSRPADIPAQKKYSGYILFTMAEGILLALFFLLAHR